MKKVLSVGVLVLVLILLAVPVKAQDATPAISASDQISVDGTVTVANVTSAGPAFVAIHADMDGMPGPVVGIAPVQAGTQENLVVPIDASGATPVLHAMLHNDDNTADAFEFERVAGADMPVLVGNQPVTATFRIAAIRVYDQMINNNAVVIASVISETGGWAVVEADEGGQPGAVLGQAPLRPGTNPGVIVPLAPEGAAGTLWVMVHTDDNEVGTFEFGMVEGADAPVMIGEQMVMAPVNSSEAPTLMNAAGQPLAATSDHLPFFNAMTQAVKGVGATEMMEDSIFTVDSLFAVGPSWLDIHADAAGHPGALLGVIPVPDGENSNVAVELNPMMMNPNAPVPIAITPVVWPMMHVDDNQPGVYEFMVIPGADLPVVVNGAVLTLPVSVGEAVTEEPAPAATESVEDAVPAATEEAAPAVTEQAGS